MKSFQLEIGGIPILIKSEESSFMQLIAEKYQAFSAPSSQYLPSNETFSNISLTDHYMQVYINVRQDEEKKRRQMLEEKLWIDVSYRHGQFFIRRPDLEGEIDVVSRVAVVTNRAAIYSFDSFLRIFFSLILVQEGGFLLHAASVVKDGCGYIFMGRSGSGKSTIAMYSDQYTVLSDEISLVKKVENHYLLYSTPFWGEQEIKGGNYYSPIQGIYRIKQSAQVESKRLIKRESFSYLMRNILYFAKEPHLTKQLFQNCLDFINKINFYELRFKKNKYFWKIIG